MSGRLGPELGCFRSGISSFNGRGLAHIGLSSWNYKFNHLVIGWIAFYLLKTDYFFFKNLSFLCAVFCYVLNSDHAYFQYLLVQFLIWNFSWGQAPSLTPSLTHLHIKNLMMGASHFRMMLEVQMAVGRMLTYFFLVSCGEGSWETVVDHLERSSPR